MTHQEATCGTAKQRQIVFCLTPNDMRANVPVAILDSRLKEPHPRVLPDTEVAEMGKLRESHTLAGVFPTPAEKGVTPDLNQLEADLRNELAKIE